MEYVKTIFIMIITLTIPCIHCLQVSTTEAAPEIKNGGKEIAQPIQTEENKDKTTEVTVKKDELEDWKNHLATLSENWNAHDNIPAASWTEKATSLAIDLVKNNKNLAADLQSSFLDALNTQSPKLSDKIVALIAEFKDAINKEPVTQEITPPENIEKEEQKPAIPQTPTLSTATPEPEQPPVANEPTPIPTEPSTTTAESTTPSNQPAAEKKETPEEKMLIEWRKCLADIKNSSPANVYTLLNDAYELAKALQSSYGVQTLRQEFYNAIETHAVKNKLPNSWKEARMNDFSAVFNVFAPGNLLPSLQTSSTQEDILQTQQQLAEQAEYHKQEMKQQAARLKALEAGFITARQASQWQEAENKRMIAEQKAANEELERKLAQSRQADRALALQLKQSAEQATASKGIISSAIATVTNWWSGTTETKQDAEKLKKQQEAFLNQLVVTQDNPAIKQKIKKAYITFQETLLAFNSSKYWDKETKQPNILWKNVITSALKILIQYKIITPTDACDRINTILSLDPTVLDETIKKKIIQEIEPILKREALNVKAEEDKKKSAQAERKKQAEEKKAQEAHKITQKMTQIELARKAELATERAEIARFTDIRELPKQEQKWAELMNVIRNNKQATTQDNAQYTTQAIQLAQLLVATASRISREEQIRLHDRLKPDFINALLAQQKGNIEPLNIYNNQVLFDRAF